MKLTHPKSQVPTPNQKIVRLRMTFGNDTVILNSNEQRIILQCRNFTPISEMCSRNGINLKTKIHLKEE